MLLVETYQMIAWYGSDLVVMIMMMVMMMTIIVKLSWLRKAQLILM